MWMTIYKISTTNSCESLFEIIKPQNDVKKSSTAQYIHFTFIFHIIVWHGVQIYHICFLTFLFIIYVLNTPKGRHSQYS